MTRERCAEQRREVVTIRRQVQHEAHRPWIDAADPQIVKVAQHARAQRHVEGGQLGHERRSHWLIKERTELTKFDFAVIARVEPVVRRARNQVQRFAGVAADSMVAVGPQRRVALGVVERNQVRPCRGRYRAERRTRLSHVRPNRARHVGR